MNELEEIKSKLDIVEVVSGYIPLKQSGRNFKAPCPFHSEKSPSFMVSPEKQIFHCFGCNEGGDVFGFVMKMEGLDFYSTLKILAEKTGVKLEERNPKKSAESRDKKTKLFAINEFACEYFQKKLKEKDGEVALKYLLERGLTEKTITEFRLGFAPKSNSSLIEELKKIGFSVPEIVEAGLAKNRDGKYMDYFWDRVMFPIADHSGSVVGFTARTLKGEVQPKYLNTPETDIYHKSNILYGMDKAKADVRKRDHIIIVEGNMDVIASHQAGIKNTIATSGTALTEAQLKIIKRFTGNIKFCFDLDNAGMEATKRAIEMAQNQGFNIKIIEIPEGKDTAEIVKKNKDIWLESCKNAKYVVDYIFEKSLSKNNKETVLGKKAIARELLGVIQKLPDKIEQDHYLKKLAKELDVDKAILHESLDKVPAPKREVKKIVEKPREKEGLDTVLEERIVVLSVLHPQYKNYIKRNLKTSYIKDDNLREILIQSTSKDFDEQLSEELRQILSIKEMKIENEFPDFTEVELGEEIFFCVRRLRDIRLREEREVLARELDTVDIKNDKEKLLKKIQDLDNKIKEQVN